MVAAALAQHPEIWHAPHSTHYEISSPTCILPHFLLMLPPCSPPCTPPCTTSTTSHPAPHPRPLQGAIIYGCIRDSEDISEMPLGVKALGTYPLKSSKRDVGLADVPVTIAGVTVEPGDWVYADRDGVLVSKEELKL